MIRVKKGNVELQIEDYSKENYIDDGWDIIDEKGEVVEHGLNIEAEYEQLLEENKKLKDELKKLKK